MSELEYAEYLDMVAAMIEEDIAALASDESDREGN